MTTPNPDATAIGKAWAEEFYRDAGDHPWLTEGRNNLAALIARRIGAMVEAGEGMAEDLDKAEPALNAIRFTAKNTIAAWRAALAAAAKPGTGATP